MTVTKKTVEDLRHELLLLGKKIRRFEMKNKLADKYRAKVSYMLMHMGLIPCKKTTLKNWYMPDYTDIINMEKEVVEK